MPADLAAERASQRNSLLAAFLGWTFDAFDFFILVMVLAPVAAEFHHSIRDMTLCFTATLAMRPVGAFLFGLMADRFGRRLPLILDILFYSLIEVLSGLAPNFTVFLILRLLYGIGMGGEWGVGASLALESVPAKWRGILSGLIQEGYALGYLLAALAYATVFPHWGWRPIFFIGGLPALLTLFVRAKVKESEAWHRSRTDWSTYRKTIFRNWPLFLYLVLLMALMNSMSHGTQDLFPTYLLLQRHFDPRRIGTITIVSMVGALCGGLAFGHYSDRRGRRRAMSTAVVLAIVLIPLWVFTSSLTLIFLGAFLMQFMVQGAWGIIPAHLNELSPDQVRGFFPGFAYQVGVLCASLISPIEAKLTEHFSYAQSLAVAMVIVMLLNTLVISVGPEAHRVAFGASAKKDSG